MSRLSIKANGDLVLMIAGEAQQLFQTKMELLDRPSSENTVEKRIAWTINGVLRKYSTVISRCCS
jgi:hypothetical protein